MCGSHLAMHSQCTGMRELRLFFVDRQLQSQLHTAGCRFLTAACAQR